VQRTWRLASHRAGRSDTNNFVLKGQAITLRAVIPPGRVCVALRPDALCLANFPVSLRDELLSRSRLSARSTEKKEAIIETFVAWPHLNIPGISAFYHDRAARNPA